tara:strand:- start:47 stop:730 length:684 start_codon:yes stop_codon:yes gene_type:complete
MTPKWFDILKVDIDFDEDIRGLGHYWKRNLVSWEDMVEAEKTGKEIPMEGIKINHKKIYEKLKNELDREPTDEELVEYVKRIIMHESGHAGHDKADPEFDDRPIEQAEYVAYMAMFPESTYLALKNYLKHPETLKKPKNIGLFMFGAEGREFKETADTIRKLILYVNKWAKNSKDKEKLTRIELAHRKLMDKKGWGATQKDAFPQDLSQALARYGKNFHKFIRRLFK